MSEVKETRCPVFYETTLYKRPPCNGKIIRREPIISSEETIGQLRGSKDIRGGRTGEGNEVPYYIYECENGHALVRPEWYADVPTVPAGTIGIHGSKEHPEWYREGERPVKNIPPGGWFKGQDNKE
ncbi:MAG: hypothetical protein SVM80_11170 [Halobacteriota archaeon]|nr:hypothetical protein [Halobacteriota archaeon]